MSLFGRSALTFGQGGEPVQDRPDRDEDRTYKTCPLRLRQVTVYSGLASRRGEIGPIRGTDMDPLTSDQWKRLREVVETRSREEAVAWLRKNHFLPEDVCLSCVKTVEDEILAAM